MGCEGTWQGCTPVSKNLSHGLILLRAEYWHCTAFLARIRQCPRSCAPGGHPWVHAVRAGVPVTVHNGQLDLICCTLGTEAWLDQLRWKGMRGFRAAASRPLYHKGQTAAFFKSHKNLAEYIILNAGHMIPSDVPGVALDILLEGILNGHSSHGRDAGPCAAVQASR